IAAEIHHAAGDDLPVGRDHIDSCVLITDHLAWLQHRFEDIACAEPARKRGQVRSDGPARSVKTMAIETEGGSKHLLSVIEISMFQLRVQQRNDIARFPIFDKRPRLGDGRYGRRWRRVEKVFDSMAIYFAHTVERVGFELVH